ncbi:MAG: alpha/beta hydrolase, partial [Thermomicrobiales bacterium]
MSSPCPPRTPGIRFSRRHALVAITVMATALAGRHPFAALAQTPGATSGEDGLTGLIEIGDRSIHVERRGTGRPTVVFEAGLLGRSDVWSRDLLEPEGERTMVLPGVADFTSVFTYDRPGTIGVVNPDLEPDGPLFHPSRSDPVPQPRTIQDIVADLHALLAAARVPGPYVLVGHSLGGLCMRLYASTYPDGVVGMVLVDATHEEVWVEFEKVL